MYDVYFATSKQAHLIASYPDAGFEKARARAMKEARRWFDEEIAPKGAFYPSQPETAHLEIVKPGAPNESFKEFFVIAPDEKSGKLTMVKMW